MVDEIRTRILLNTMIFVSRSESKSYYCLGTQLAQSATPWTWDLGQKSCKPHETGVVSSSSRESMQTSSISPAWAARMVISGTQSWLDTAALNFGLVKERISLSEMTWLRPALEMRLQERRSTPRLVLFPSQQNTTV